MWFDAPIDPEYLTAGIEYSTDDSITWIRVGEMPYAAGYVVLGLNPNTFYTFRVISINHVGQANMHDIITARVYSTGSAEPPDVTGVQILGKGTDTTFVGRDCTITWTGVSAEAGTPAIIGYIVVGIWFQVLFHSPYRDWETDRKSVV